MAAFQVFGRGRIWVFANIQVYTWRSGGSPDIVDSLFSDRETLQSLREVRLVGDTVIVATYTPDSIVIETRASNGPDRRTAVASGGAYYSSAALEALVTDAALAPGYSTVVRLYYAPPSAIGFHEANLRVVRSERIAAREGPQRNAWVVTAGTAGGVTTFWIDKATRTVLKYDTREGRALIEFRR